MEQNVSMPVPYIVIDIIIDVDQKDWLHAIRFISLNMGQIWQFQGHWELQNSLI